MHDAQPWLMAPDGSQSRPLLASDEPRHETVQLDWSPDGAQALLSRLPLDDPRASTQLWLVDVTSGAAPRLLGAGNATTWLP